MTDPTIAQLTDLADRLHQIAERLTDMAEARLGDRPAIHYSPTIDALSLADDYERAVRQMEAGR